MEVPASAPPLLLVFLLLLLLLFLICCSRLGPVYSVGLLGILLYTREEQHKEKKKVRLGNISPKPTDHLPAGAGSVSSNRSCTNLERDRMLPEVVDPERIIIKRIEFYRARHHGNPGKYTVSCWRSFIYETISTVTVIGHQFLLNCCILSNCLTDQLSVHWLRLKFGVHLPCCRHIWHFRSLNLYTHYSFVGCAVGCCIGVAVREPVPNKAGILIIYPVINR